jgi:hypothetical protein
VELAARDMAAVVPQMDRPTLIRGSVKREGSGALKFVLRHLAAVYAGHPDYPLEQTR